MIYTNVMLVTSTNSTHQCSCICNVYSHRHVVLTCVLLALYVQVLWEYTVQWLSQVFAYYICMIIIVSMQCIHMLIHMPSYMTEVISAHQVSCTDKLICGVYQWYGMLWYVLQWDNSRTYVTFEHIYTVLTSHTMLHVQAVNKQHIPQTHEDMDKDKVCCQMSVNCTYEHTCMTCENTHTHEMVDVCVDICRM